MGGVDLADQHIQVYDPDFRSVKLWKKLLVNMILRVIGIAFKYSFVIKTHKNHVNVVYKCSEIIEEAA